MRNLPISDALSNTEDDSSLTGKYIWHVTLYLHMMFAPEAVKWVWKGESCKELQNLLDKKPTFSQKHEIVKFTHLWFPSQDSPKTSGNVFIIALRYIERIKFASCVVRSLLVFGRLLCHFSDPRKSIFSNMRSIILAFSPNREGVKIYENDLQETYSRWVHGINDGKTIDNLLLSCALPISLS